MKKTRKSFLLSSPDGSPVKLVHAPVSDQRRPQSRQVVSGQDDGNTWHDVSLPIVLPDADPGRVIRQVHEGAHNHLSVDRHLRVCCGKAKAACLIVTKKLGCLTRSGRE
jgi:hypothetical protein